MFSVGEETWAQMRSVFRSVVCCCRPGWHGNTETIYFLEDTHTHTQCSDDVIDALSSLQEDHLKFIIKSKNIIMVKWKIYIALWECFRVPVCCRVKLSCEPLFCPWLSCFVVICCYTPYSQQHHLCFFSENESEAVRDRHISSMGCTVI